MVVIWRNFARVYGLKSKAQAAGKIDEFFSFVARQATVEPSQIKTIRTDGGTEFVNRDFRRIVAREGIRHQHFNPHSSFQNSTAERAIRTLTEMATAMMVGSALPHYLWEEALKHAAYIHNRVLHTGENEMRSSRMFSVPPGLSRLPVFGQAVAVRIPDDVRRKRFRIRGRAKRGAFIGMSNEVRGFRIFTPGDGRRITESRDVTLLDSVLHERISVRHISHVMIALTEVIREPLNMSEARRSKQWPYWHDAVKEELAALEEYDTFELVDAPENELALDNTVQF
ncbi:hypothetical protein PR002_g24888 [Phytophthora rubi]|uniref:Integrase catalytic domain-containing protein n=1 Tax=Phytophthora rubi TaxID=129364 RepID=A0A6A3I6Y6_9STRA|nr:hypothetical protein PR002_g24888 [Phytophthora rubi]